jgi:hypothetical protein
MYVRATSVGFGKDYLKDGGSDTSTLMRRANVQMIEKKPVGVRPNDGKADALPTLNDRARELGLECAEEPCTRALRIEATNALKALMHGIDSQRGQGLSVVSGDGFKSDGRSGHECTLTLELTGAQGTEAPKARTHLCVRVEQLVRSHLRHFSFSKRITSA